MTAKKISVETSVETCFVVPMAELLDHFIPKEERKPTCTWWIHTDALGRANIMRSERTAIGYDEEGRERLEEEREDTHNEP